MWDGNRGLGKIPIVAHVVNPATGDAVSGIRVCFEIVQPYDNPEDQKAYLSDISNASEKTRSPRRYIDRKLPTAANPPFGFNCPESKGGKTPADVHGPLFAQVAVPGFPHQVSVDGRPNAFSVMGTTDADGNTGAVFLPSRMAGDCYKIRVHVMVEGREAVQNEIKTSGVLTVWRSLRISRIILKPHHGAFAGSPPLDASYVGALGSIHISQMTTEFAKSFHALEADHHARHPMTMGERGYRDAIAYAKRGLSNPNNYDLNALIKEDVNSPFLFWLESDTAYNAAKSPASNSLDLTLEESWDQIESLIGGLTTRFMQYWNGGALPGVTIIRSEVGDSYSYWNNPHKPAEWCATTSGVATNKRGCYLWYTAAIYADDMPYGITQNTLHEMGHVLYLRHHWTDGGLDSESGGFSSNHDNRDWCLMGYLNLTTDDYCGKCLLKLRGWDETAI
jgi:hypothetical protein